MSRILKHKKLLAVVCIIIVIEILMLFFWPTVKYISFAIVVDVVLATLMLLDWRVVRKIYGQMKPFGAQSRIRNVDCLVIGETVDVQNIMPENCRSYTQIKVPDLTEEGAYQILRRTHSILKGQGIVVIPLKEVNLSKKKVRLMDLLFLHDISAKELGFEKLSKVKKYALFFNPISCIKMLFNKDESGYHEKFVGGGTAIIDFCKERGYAVHYFVK